MTGTRTHLAAERAPCGRLVEGDRTREGDSEGLVIDIVTYACGCRSTRQEYHDGSVERRVVRHDGKVLVDEEHRGE